MTIDHILNLIEVDHILAMWFTRSIIREESLNKTPPPRIFLWFYIHWRACEFPSKHRRV